MDRRPRIKELALKNISLNNKNTGIWLQQTRTKHTKDENSNNNIDLLIHITSIYDNAMNVQKMSKWLGKYRQNGRKLNDAKNR